MDFPDPITSFLSLGFIGLPLTPYFLCLHYFWACSNPFLLFLHHILPMGMLFLSFRAFFKPIYLLKSHLFISWTRDPLFLPLGPDGFATSLPNLCSLLLGFFAFHLDSQKWPSTRTYRTCNPTVEFSKYKFINKLLGGVTLLKVISCVTWT